MTLNFLRQNHQWLDSVYPSPVFTAFIPNTYLYEHPEEFGVEPGMHSLFWASKDGKNTYPVRMDRFERFCRLCLDLGIKTIYRISEEQPEKWKLLGDYYRYIQDFDTAISCYKNDLLKYGYSHNSVEYILESIRHGDAFDKSGPLKGLDKLISFYDDEIRSLRERAK